MNKYKGYLICTDCDGTLTNSDGKLSDENARAIKYFQSEGGLFTLATGRFPNHVDLFADKFRVNAPLVSLNGALLYDTLEQKVINSWTMNKNECREVLEYIQWNWKEVWEYWINFSYDKSIGYKPMENKPGDGSLINLLNSLPDIMYKNVFVQPREITTAMQKDLREHFGEKFRFDTSWPEGLEMQSNSSGKGIAIKYMKENMALSIHTTIAVGDYENDINMLECADVSYAVSNAIDIVKDKAMNITVSNNEDAIAKIIYSL